MYKVYDRWPEIAREAFESNQRPIDFENIEHIVFAGMGGSGSLGDIFASILSKTNIHVSVVKGYLLPKTVNANSLIITTSVSGNTDESLNILNSAHQMGCKVVGFSSGGKMKEICINNKIEFREISQIHSPRASFTKFLFSMLKILTPVIPISENMIKESIEHITKLKNQIDSSNINENNSALNLAKWINGIPLVYYPAGLQAAAIRFKNSFQENAKLHVISEDVVEACHNGIVAWEKPSNFNPILLQGDEDFLKTKERWQILKDYFNENKIEFREIYSIKGNILSKLIHLTYLFDYASIYKAVLDKTDPTPVNSINFIKERL